MVAAVGDGADDDAVCVKENVDDAESMFSDNANLLLVRTKSGSHCAFMEWGGGSWANRVAIHWIQEVLALQKQCDAYAKSGALTWRKKTRVDEVTVDSATGAVSGVRWIDKDGNVGFDSAKSVVLATGGLQAPSLGADGTLPRSSAVFVALWFRFVLREPTRRTVWLALTVALLGLALVAEVWRGFSFEVIGLLAALGAALALSAHYLVTDRQMRLPEPRDPVSLTMWGFGFASLFWVIVQPWWSFPWSDLSGTSSGDLGAPLGEQPLWGLSLWMIVMGTVVPFWLVVASMRHLRASQASVVGLTEPLLAILIAWLVLSESLAIVQLVGGALILTGVVLAERSRQQR